MPPFGKPKAEPKHPDWFDMQGLILSAYPDQDQAQYLLYSINPGREADARLWLNRILPLITPASKFSHTNARMKVNVAVTATGLARLGGAAALSGFPDAFVEGIAGNAHRSRVLGHVGDNDPGKWDWGGSAKPAIDILLMVFAAKKDSLAACVRDVAPPAGPVMTERAQLAATLPRSDAGNKEHFGFADGISQPILVGTDDAERFPESTHLTALGEIVHGYPDAYGEISTLALAENGSFLVFSQFSQDVDRFWNFANTHTSINGRPDPSAATELASKLVGRWPDGTPLVPYVNKDDNEFGFAQDPYGYGCPIGSHIRRANPRDSFGNTNTFPPDTIKANRHRILRRGRPYGKRVEDTSAKPGEERGLYFVCLNADFERQFEFIQQNWINNPSFLGLNGERDPLIGDGLGGVTVPALPAPVCATALQQFVTTRGAEYFFLPSLSALRRLASPAHGR